MTTTTTEVIVVIGAGSIGQAIARRVSTGKHVLLADLRLEAVRWGKRGARVNTISPGIVMTPLARDELTGPRRAGYQRMIELCPAGRAGTPDEIGTLGAFLMGPDGGFITGSDFLIDGGVTASYFYGELAPT